MSGLSGVDHDLICLLAPSLFKYHVSKFFEIQFPAVENKSSPLVLRMISYAKKKKKKSHFKFFYEDEPEDRVQKYTRAFRLICFGVVLTKVTVVLISRLIFNPSSLSS